jgi:hypothetical protein
MRGRTRAATAALVALAVVDVILVALALGVRGPGAPVAARQSGVEPPSAASLAPSGPAATGRTATTVPAPLAGVVGRQGPGPIPVAARSGLILRADPGSCRAGGAVLWSSVDGARWEKLRSPAGEIRRVAVESPTDMWVVGGQPPPTAAEGRDASTGAGCQAAFWRSSDGGRAWGQARTTDGAWYVPVDGSGKGLHAPYAVLRAVCEATDPLLVVPAGFDSAAVGCVGGTIRWTDDGGQSWRWGEQRRGLVALGLWSSTDGLAVTLGGACAGLSVSATDDGGRTWRPRSCITPVAGGSADPVGLAAYDDTRAVLVRGSGPRPLVWLSQDAGRTWRTAGEG